MKKIILILVATSFWMQAQVTRTEPPFWWSGMKETNIQIMMYGDNLNLYNVKSDAAIIKNVITTENPNYLFVNLDLTNQEAGDIKFTLTAENNPDIEVPYSFYERRENSSQRQGYDSSDMIYLIMPDRFANGDPYNDDHPILGDFVNRNNRDGRHGGDIAGIIQNLDYLESLGVTAIWSTPLLESNNPQTSYHTYAQSDVYQIDPRYGSNEEYKLLSAEMKRRDMKLIMDYIFNHWSTNHWMIKDPPSSDWINHWDQMTNTNHRKEIYTDPYRSQYDMKQLTDGWFDSHMADLNQRNPLFLNYLIHNAIWWIEYADLGGFRVDTYPYNDKEAITSWAKAILNEYPNFNIVSESWVESPIHSSYWQKDSPIAAISGFNAEIPSVKDFATYFAITQAFKADYKEWDHGLNLLYKTLQNDFVYNDVFNLMTFVENHDTNRINDFYPKFEDYKLVMSFLATVRGIPQLYYGSEIGMTGKKNVGDGDIRRDFPGGWTEDKTNAFDPNTRSEKQNNYFNFTAKLFNWRKNKSAIHTGKTMHFAPENDTYVFFRYHDNEKVMVVLNASTEDQKINVDRFSEILSEKKGTDMLSGDVFLLEDVIELKARTPYIIEL